jgi:ketosteroid isomerase-like protein
MKKPYFIIIPCVVLIFYACKPKVDIEKETEAIKALINNETQAFLQNDTAKVLSYYIQDDYQTRLSVSCDTVRLYKGWKELSAFFKNVNLTGMSNPKNTKDFIQIKVTGDAAWAIYRDNWTNTHVAVVQVDASGRMRDTIVISQSSLLCTMNLEKKLNEWKISSFSIFSSNH